MILTVKKIFGKPKTLALGVTIAIVVSLVFLSIPQFRVVTDIFSIFNVTDSRFWTSIYSIILMSVKVMSSLEIVVLILLALLLGANAVIFLTYLKQYKKQLSFAGTNLSLLAMMLGVFGVGCLSCGVLLLAPIISLFGISTAIWVTQYGVLMSAVSCVLVAYSCYLLLKKISNPQVCTPII